MASQRLIDPCYAYQLYLRQRLVAMVASDSEEWWKDYTIYLRLYDKAADAPVLTVTHNLTPRFDTDVTGSHNYDARKDVEYDGALLFAQSEDDVPDNLAYNVRVGSEHALRLWLHDPDHLHAECFIQDRRTRRLALLYRTSARDVAVGRRVDEDGVEAGIMAVDEVFKPSNQEVTTEHDVWVRLQYTFSVQSQGEEMDQNLSLVPQTCTLLAEGLVRKPRPYGFESGEEWQSVREWIEGLEWH